MRAWTAPELPTLAVKGPEVALHDTASGALVQVVPEGAATLYVCGITPYDATHMGHAATYVGFDLLNRAWRNAGHSVVYAQNVTDVDDPLLERANKVAVDWRELAERETELYRQDMEALRVLPPAHYTGAVESIPLVIAFIERLQAAGAVYRVDDDLYFSVTADADFGAESGLTREQMLEIFPQRGGDPDRPGKKDPLDCVLWLAERPGEPSWPSPFGPGRPGWHIECVAIALANLGMQFDVQGGGSDLAFPHHEMGASHAQVAVGQHPYARAYVHAGMVGLEGEKMSKSKGNLVFVHKLREAGADPMAIRLALLAHPYRADWEYTDTDLTAAEARLAHWRGAVALATGPDPQPILDGARAALANDLDAPAVLQLVDAWAAAASEGDGTYEGAGAVVSDLVDALLGIAL